MNTVSRALQRPSRSLTSQLRRSIRQHHHRAFPSPSTSIATSHHNLRSGSPSLLRTSSYPPLSQAHRTFSHSSTTMAAVPKFARGIDGSKLQPELDSLLEQGWALDQDGMGVKKTYYFKTYFKAVVCSFLVFLSPTNLHLNIYTHCFLFAVYHTSKANKAKTTELRQRRRIAKRSQETPPNHHSRECPTQTQ